MKLNNERLRYVYKYDITDYTEEELRKLRKIALERFAKDEHAQLEYAVDCLVSDAVDAMVMNEIEEKSI